MAVIDCPSVIGLINASIKEDAVIASDMATKDFTNWNGLTFSFPNIIDAINIFSK